MGPKTEWEIIVLDDLAAPAAQRSAWQDLADHAAEKNVFHEPFMFLPALEHMRQDEKLCFVLIYRRDFAVPPPPKMLCGFFPLERVNRRRGLPLTALLIWQHIHCFLSTPLVRDDCVRETLEQFLNWLQTAAAGVPLFEPRLLGDGLVFQNLANLLLEREQSVWLSDCHARALIRPRADGNPEAYIEASISHSSYKDFKRKQRRLAELGKVETVRLTEAADVNRRVDDFFRVESEGWKGANQTALAQSAVGRAFFRDTVCNAFAEARLMFLALRLDDQPIAMKCNLLAGRGSFAFKIAFDEKLALFSPGLILEAETIRLLHQDRQFDWMDSCADPVHFMINRLWTERRTITSLVVSTGRRPGDLAIACLPILKWGKIKIDSLRRKKAPSGSQPPDTPREPQPETNS